MDKDGQFVGTLAYGEARDTMMEKLKRLVAGA
jgi:protein SCO1/2